MWGGGGARSAAIALMNMAPVYYLDGDAALDAALELVRAPAELPNPATAGRRRERAPSVLSQQRASWLHRWALRCGSAVFAAVLAAHVIKVSSLDGPLSLALRRLHSAVKFLFRGRD